jgi:hypothetical protein
MATPLSLFLSISEGLEDPMGHLGASGLFPDEAKCTSRTALVLRICVAGVLVLAAAGCKSSSSTLTGTVTPTGTIATQATASKPTYAITEPVVANLVITNGTGAAVGLSPMTDGTLSVIALTRNGVAVPSREVRVKFDEDLLTLLRGSIQSVAPGESLSFTWTSSADTVLQGQSLKTVKYRPGGASTVVIYSVSLPGQYELVVRYALPAEAARPGEVVQNPADPVTVRFTVSP